MNIGAAIRQIRQEQGATQEAVALEAGTFAGNLSKIERGQQLPSLELLLKIAGALNVKASALFVLAEATSAEAQKPTSESENDNAAILLRRHFLKLTPTNQRLAVELLKTINRVQQS